MFDIGLPEFVVIALLALIVFGPDRMPEMVGQAARWLRKVRSQASDVTSQFTQELDIPELNELTGRGRAKSAQVRVEPARQAVLNTNFDQDCT